MRRQSWMAYLCDYDRRATVQLGRPRRPWRYFDREVPGLWRRTGSPAQVRGIFNITLEFDPDLRGCGTMTTVFVMEHEFRHMVGKHPFWLLITLLLCCPLYPLVRVLQERAADRAAARLMPPSIFLGVASRLHRRGVIHRLLYGSPLTRTQRAYRLSEEEVIRWVGAAALVAATR